jgi:hypothetical protein
MYYCNNIMTPTQPDEMERRNRLVFRFARNWTETHKNKNNFGVHTVYVLDQGRLNDELMEWNARLLGFGTSTNSNYTDVKLHTKIKTYGCPSATSAEKWFPTIAAIVFGTALQKMECILA